MNLLLITKNLLHGRKKYKIEENATAEEAFYKFKDKYEVKSENIEDIRKNNFDEIYNYNNRI